MATWYLGNWPDNFVVALSHTSGYARDNIGAPARALFERVGQEYFGQRIDPRSDAGDRWSILGRRGGFVSDGIGGSIEGRRIDLVILDDVIGTLVDAESARFREMQWAWYQAQLYPRLAPGAVIILTMSRWHQDDLAGRMIEAGRTGTGPTPTVLDMPAIALQPHEYADGCDPLGRQPGEALWPEVRPIEFLEATRRSVGPRVFDARFQGRPRPSEGSLFKRSWFRYYDVIGDGVRLRDARGVPTVAYARSSMRVFQMVDLAVTSGSGDYFVVGTFGLCPLGELVVLDIYRARVEGPSQLGILRSLQQKWGAGRIGIEAVGYQAAFVQAAIADGLPAIPIKRTRQGGGKEMRAQGIASRYEGGTVFHPRTAPWLDALESELEDFPTGAHDDQVDVLSDAGEAVIGRVVAGSEAGTGARVGGVRIG
jgi:predicted phage terminase large subunit-like protein